MITGKESLEFRTLYRVRGHVHVNSALEKKSPDFRRIGGGKVWISAALEGGKVISAFWRRKSPDLIPMIISWKKVRNSEPLYRGCAHIFWNSPIDPIETLTFDTKFYV